MQKSVEIKLGLNGKHFYLRIFKSVQDSFDMEDLYIKRIVNLVSKISTKLNYSTGNVVEVGSNNPFESQESFIFKFDFRDDEEWENRELLRELNEIIPEYFSCCSQCVYESIYKRCQEKYKYLFFTEDKSMKASFRNLIYGV